MVLKSTLNTSRIFIAALLMVSSVMPNRSNAQSSNPPISNFVLFGANGVQISSSASVPGGGATGSRVLVKTTGGVQFGGGIFSASKIELAGGNSVAGRVSAGVPGLTGLRFSAGSSTIINGNLDVAGNATISTSGSSVNGNIITSGTYSGPSPSGTLTQGGTPSLVTLPANPAGETFSINGATNDPKNTVTLTPGSDGFYRARDLSATGGKTITLNGPGTYIFKSIKLTNSNTFLLDFKGNASGKFKILVEGNMDLAKVSVDFKGLSGSPTVASVAAKLYSQANGTGNSGGNGFEIANGSPSNSSRWIGTVWVPNSNILIGSGTGNTSLTGALWSGKTVTLNSGVTVSYSPLAVPGDCSQASVTITKVDNVNVVVNGNTITGDIPCDKQQVNITTTTTISNPVYAWTALSGYIVSGGNSASPTISSAGVYKVVVTNSDGCSANAQVSVTSCLDRSVDQTPDRVEDIVIDPILKAFLLDPNTFKKDPEEKDLIVVVDGRVLIEVILNKAQLATALSTLRGLTGNGYEEISYVQTEGEQIVTCLFNISDVLIFDLTPGYNALFDYVRPAYLPAGQQGSITSSGDQAIQANIARNAYKLNGNNVKIAVFSDSYNNQGGELSDILSDNLPGRNPDNSIDASKKVNVVKDYPTVLGAKSDEGRAMLQIVHDVAPGASLLFRTAFISESDFAGAIKEMAAPVSQGGKGADVLIDDLSYLTAPFFKDGMVAKAISSVTAAGAKYITSAGNFGFGSFEAVFVPGGPAGGRKSHNFAPAGEDTLQQISLSKRGSYLLVLQWEDPFYSLDGVGTDVDMDMYVADAYGNTLLGYNRNNIGSDPFEVCPIFVEGPTTLNVKIVRANGSRNVRFKWVAFRNRITIDDYPNANPSTIIGHANSDAAISVGAVEAQLINNNSPLEIRFYSSWGGTRMTNESNPRFKPDVVGPDGVLTSVVFGGITDVFNGTSAAAPHVGAVAALLLEANQKFAAVPGSLNQENIRSILKSTAQSFGQSSGGYNFKSGSGLVQAANALASLYNPVPGIVEWLNNGSLTPGANSVAITIKGSSFINSSKVYLRKGPNQIILTPTSISPTEIVVTIPTFLGNPDISVYNPPKTAGNYDGGFSDPIFLLSVTKKTLTVYANNKTKQYGEALPSNDVTILENGVELAKGSDGKYLSAELISRGLSDLAFTVTQIDEQSEVSDVTKSTVPGTYPIRVVEPVIPSETLELFDYEFNMLGGSPKPGTLTITQLALKIKPKSQTFTYGNRINVPIEYDYDFTGNFSSAERIALKQEIDLDYKSIMETDKLALVQMNWTAEGGIPLVNGQPVTSIAMLITSKALNGLTQANGLVSVNGIPIANIPPEVMISYFNSVVNGVPLATGVPVANGVALRGFAVANGFALSRGLVSVNMVNGVVQTNYGIPIVNGVTQVGGIRGLPLVNGLVTANALAQANGLTLANVSGAETNAVATVNDIPVTNGVVVTNSEAAVIIGEEDIVTNADGVAVVTGEYRSINMITGVTVGHHKIIPAAFMTKVFKVTVELGDLIIEQKPASVTPVNATKVYGTTDPSPLTTGTLSGFEADDNITANYNRVEGETVGDYTITATLTPPGKLFSYNISYGTAVFSITKASVILQVNNTGVPEGTAPTFTYTVQPALKQGDVLSVTYVVKDLAGNVKSNLTTLVPGTYTVTPVASNPNYNIELRSGFLIVNTVGVKARAIKPILECVTVAANPATNGGYGYIANFAYENQSTTDVWIERGENNFINPSGHSDDSRLPTIFKSGGGRFIVPFDGTKIDWTVISYEKSKRTTSTTSQASSTSSRCPNNFVPAGANARVAQNAQTVQIVTEVTGKAYPNPVTQKTIVETGFAPETQVTVRLMDQMGREYNTFTSRKLSGSKIEVDMSRLSTGNYFIRVTGKDETKVFKVIKL